MNYIQKCILTGAALLIIGMVVYPPFKANAYGTTFNLGYHFIFQPPNRLAVINSGTLMVQILATVIVSMLIALSLKNYNYNGALFAWFKDKYLRVNKIDQDTKKAFYRLSSAIIAGVVMGYAMLQYLRNQ